MTKYHDISKIHFTTDEMLVTIDGKDYKFKLTDISPILEKASDTNRNNFELSPSGYGIHWPSIDEDLSIDGLLGIHHKSPRRQKKLEYR